MITKLIIKKRRFYGDTDSDKHDHSSEWGGGGHCYKLYIEILTAKKPQMTQELVKKNSIIKFIAFSHKKILQHFNLETVLHNLLVGDQVPNILFNSYISVAKLV